MHVGQVLPLMLFINFCYNTKQHSEFFVNAETFGMIVFASGVSHVKKKGIVLYDGPLAPLLLLPPSSQYNLILPPLGEETERNPVLVHQQLSLYQLHHCHSSQ